MNLEQSNKFLKEWKALKAKGSTNWNEKKNQNTLINIIQQMQSVKQLMNIGVEWTNELSTSKHDHLILIHLKLKCQFFHLHYHLICCIYRRSQISKRNFAKYRSTSSSYQVCCQLWLIT
jgi:hypothetical protein